MKRTARVAFALIGLAAFLFLYAGMSVPGTAWAAEETKKIFILNSYHQGYPFSDNEMRGISEAFSKSGIKIEKYILYMDVKRITPTPRHIRQLKELIALGYKGMRFDALIATDNDALEFMRKYRDELFPGVPLVFAGINDLDVRMLDGRKDITGTVESADYAGTIKVALKLLPATKNIIIVTDNTTTGVAVRSEIQRISEGFPQSLGFSYLSLGDMTIDGLAQKLSELGTDSIVLLLHHSVDKIGTDITVDEGASLLAKSSSAPSFVVNDSRIGFGALGGLLISGYHQGETAAQMVVKILSGTDIGTIPALRESPNKYMFDYRAMQRFGISDSALPQGSIVINKPVPILDRYRNELLFILGVFIVLSGILVFLLIEIRRRRKIEKTLRESTELLSLFMKHSPVYTYIKDVSPTKSCVLMASENFADMIGIPGSAMVGKAMEELFPAEFAAKITADDWSVASGGKVLGLDEELTGRYYTTVKFPSVYGDKNLLAGYTIDITDRMRADQDRAQLEAELLQAQKMQAIGQLAGGIAHDFNNILAAISSIGYLLELQLKGNDTGKQYVSDLMQAVERAAALTQSLLIFSRKQHSNPQPMDLNSAIQKAEKILARTISEDIQLVLLLTGQNTTVHADSNQIVQILMNLATNARDAMPRGGDLTISTERVFLDEDFMKMHDYGSCGEYVLMNVRDTGVGMDAATLQRAFEPFFTTKEVGKGTGLGLSMVYGIVKQHNGYIDLFSKMGEETSVRIYLPAVEAMVEHRESRDYFEPEVATETILLVEDDSNLRRAMTLMLQRFGHAVIEAHDGDDAIIKFLAHKAEIQLVLMDVIMPRKSGGDAYQELKAIQPDLKIILMSGYAGDFLSGKISIGEDVHFIPKPVSPKELFEKIRTVLNGGDA